MSTPRHLPLLLTLALLTAAPFPALTIEPPPEPPPEEPPAIPFKEQDRRLFGVIVDRIVRQQMEEWRVPGAAVALVEEGRILVLEGYGLADVAAVRPVDPLGTVFHVASLSKPVTASAMLQLVDRGLLDLDTDVNHYLESLSVPETFPEPVTVRHLLTHTGGFDERIIDRKTRDGSELPELADYLRLRLPPRIRPPGLVSVYSNHGYALAGLVASDILEMPFDRYVEEALFEPLGMTRSSFGPSPRTALDLATGYGWQGLDGEPVPLDHIKTLPASMLLTTAADMSRWMRAILDHGNLERRRVLASETAAALTSRQFTNHVSIPGRSLGLSEGGRFEPPGWIHAGGSSGFTSALVLLPGHRAGLFVVFNSQTYIWETVNRILDRYASPGAAEEVEEIVGIDTDLERFAGHYREAGISTTTIEKLATLVDQERVGISGGRDLLWRGHSYRAVGRLVFQRVSGRTRLGFVEDGGQVRYLSYPGTVQEKVHWFESRPVQLGVWGLFMVVFLAAGGGWIGFALPRVRRTLHPVSPPAAGRWTLRLASWASILNLLFLVFLGIVLARALEGGGELQYGVPKNLRLVLSIPPLTSLLSLVVVSGTVVAWTRNVWSLGTRLKLSLVALTLLAFAFHLHYWNLLGFRF